MTPEKCVKSAFSVLGKAGSTQDGPDFVAQLWAEANAHFSEIEALAATDENGMLRGLWGAMSDMSRSFLHWLARCMITPVLPMEKAICTRLSERSDCQNKTGMSPFMRDIPVLF